MLREYNSFDYIQNLSSSEFFSFLEIRHERYMKQEWARTKHEHKLDYDTWIKNKEEKEKLIKLSGAKDEEEFERLQRLNI